MSRNSSDSKWSWNPFTRKSSKSRPHAYPDSQSHPEAQTAAYPPHGYSIQHHSNFVGQYPHPGYTSQPPPPFSNYGSLWRPQGTLYPGAGPAALTSSSGYESYPSATVHFPPSQPQPYYPPFNPVGSNYYHPAPHPSGTRSRSDSTHSRYQPSSTHSHHIPHPSTDSTTSSVDHRPNPRRGSSQSRPSSWYENQRKGSLQGYDGYYETHADSRSSPSVTHDFTSTHPRHLQPRPQSSLSTRSRSRERPGSRNAAPTTVLSSRMSTASPASPHKLSSLLHARMREYPSIDWAIWDPLTRVDFFVGPGQYGDKNPIYRSPAFTGTVSVREPVFIEAPPGQVDGLYLAITRWGPIKVSPRDQKELTIRDVIEEIDDWMKMPLHSRDWGGFDDTFKNEIFSAYARRKRHSKPLQPLPDNPIHGARRVDTLFCQVVWDGLELAQDYARSKKLHLRLQVIRPVRD